MNYGILP